MKKKKKRVGTRAGDYFGLVLVGTGGFSYVPVCSFSCIV